MEHTLYIHYGHDRFVRPEPIRNREYFTKPRGGLWASRKYGEQTWKDWCESEDFRLDSFNTNFEFRLKDGARVLELKTVQQLEDLPKFDSGFKYSTNDRLREYHLDFEELKKTYDAVEVTDIGALYRALYGWDCNSILIMNPDIVEVIREKGECSYDLPGNGD